MSARLLIFGPAGLDPRRVGILRDTAPAEFVTYETAPGLVYEYKPNLDVFFKLVRFRTNSRGVRDEQYALARPPNTFRVAVVGSSFALPAAVEIEDAFHSLLEDRFSRELAPTRYEFLDFAIGMHGPSRFLAMLGESSRDSGVPFVVVRVEFDPRDPSAVERVVEQRVRSAGMFYVDTREAFRGTDPRDFWIYALDPHPDRAVPPQWISYSKGTLCGESVKKNSQSEIAAYTTRIAIRCHLYFLISSPAMFRSVLR